MKIVTFSEITGKDGVFIDGDWVESKDQDPNGDVRLIQLADIGDGWFINKSNRFLKKETAKKLKCTFLKPGDVLIARMPDPLGRACIFPGLEMPCVTVVDVCIIRPDEKLAFNEWLKFLINSYDFRNTINQYITGTTRLRISRGNLAKLPFKLPSLQDQIKIAKLLTQVESLIIKRKESILMLDELLKSTFLEMFGDPAKNEKRWEQISIAEVIDKIITESPGKFPDKEYDYFDIAAVNNKTKEIEDVKNVLGLNAPSRARQLLEINDIIVSTVRPNLNAVALIKLAYQNPIASTGFCVLRCTEDINHHYLFMMTKSNYFINELLKNIKGANYPAVSAKEVKNVIIPIPPLDLQKQFAAIVEKVETLKVEYKKSLVELENLFGVLSQKAFKGDLVKSEENKLDIKKDDAVMEEEPDEIIDNRNYIREKNEKVDITNMTFAEYIDFPEDLQVKHENWMFNFLEDNIFYQFLLKDNFNKDSFTLSKIETQLHDFFYHEGDMDFDNEKWRRVIFEFMKADPPLIVQRFDEVSATIKLELTDEAYKA